MRIRNRGGRRQSLCLIEESAFERMSYTHDILSGNVGITGLRQKVAGNDSCTYRRVNRPLIFSVVKYHRVSAIKKLYISVSRRSVVDILMIGVRENSSGAWNVPLRIKRCSR